METRDLAEMNGNFPVSRVFELSSLGKRVVVFLVDREFFLFFPGRSGFFFPLDLEILSQGLSGKLWLFSCWIWSFLFIIHRESYYCFHACSRVFELCPIGKLLVFPLDRQFVMIYRGKLS